MRMQPPARVTVALVALLALAFARPRTAHASNLWIAFETGEDRWRGQVEDFFACLLGASNFNTLIGGHGGVQLRFAGDAVVGHCAANDSQCVASGASFGPMLQHDDVLLYLNGGGCGGFNDHPVNVTVGGRTVAIRWGEVGDVGVGNTKYLSCQTAPGMHEVYEAATNGISGDCCNHQTNFAGMNEPQCGGSGFGWFTLNGCAGQSFQAQALSPGGQDFNPAACSNVAVDTAALCAQPRAARDRGVCMGGNVVRCSLGPTTEDCNGLGCSDTPAPHCNTFNANCQLHYPSTMCSGSTTEVTVSCANTGSVVWNGDVQFASLPQGRASLFADSSWISPSVAVASQPAMVPMGSMGTFSFRMHAPEVVGPIAYTLHWSLVQGGTYESSPAPDALAMDIMVQPCAMDAGVDAAVAVDAGSDHDGGDHPTVSMAGCGCGVPAPTAPKGIVWIVLAGAVALIRARRR